MNWRAGRDGTRPPDARAPAEYVHAQRAVKAVAVGEKQDDRNTTTPFSVHAGMEGYDAKGAGKGQHEVRTAYACIRTCLVTWMARIHPNPD